MSTILRISEIATEEKISIGTLEKAIGASKGVLSRALKNNTDIQSKWIQSIIENYPQYNANWLLTGVGSMFFANDSLQIAENSSYYATKSKKKEVSHNTQIPLLTAGAIKKLANNNFDINEDEIKANYIIPKFAEKKIDFMLEFIGDSMLPRYKSGDILACTVIKGLNFIQWNRPHVIITKQQGILVKRLRKSKLKDSLFAVSDNAQYEPFDLPTSEISGIALIVGGIFEE